jgi:hypothetical protein
MFRQLRILFLLLVLLFVAAGTWYSRAKTTDWDETLYIAIYPINADGSEASARFIDQLSPDDFLDIEQFLAREALRYRNISVKPVSIEIAPAVTELPPPAPRGGNRLQVALWSLKMRYWAWQNDTAAVRPDIQAYVLYYDPAVHSVLDHSLGLEKGLVSVIKAFAGNSHRKRNNVIITHELLHTVGATDKYDLATNLPLHPIGFAEPERSPLYPQQRAEIMGGRIPLSPVQARQPGNVWQTVVGPATALEIGWIDEL